MRRLFITPALVIAAVLFGGARVVAHHSFIAYDLRPEAEVVMEGVVKEWALINPHSWLTITVSKPDGTKADWSFEAAGVPQLIPRGITAATFKVGDTIMVAAAPLKDGRNGGALKFVRHADGTFTLPNDVGKLGPEALERWKAKNGGSSGAGR